MSQSKSNEWGTTADVIKAARLAMGAIDLDPASCKLANRTVQAATYYSIQDNGFLKHWKADSVWMNPPYGRRSNELKIYGASAWVRKLVDAWKNNYVRQFCCLVRDSNAKYPLIELGCFSCEPLYRLPFIDLSTGQLQESPMHNCNIYGIGMTPAHFIEAFQPIGCVRHRALPL